MAKVGNEARLILSLAKEKVAARKEAAIDRELRLRRHDWDDNHEEAYKMGVELGIALYQGQLDVVVTKLQES